MLWELIEENKRKSIILFFSMGMCLIVLGYILGTVSFPPDGGMSGVIIAFFIWGILSAISFFIGDSIILASSNAQEISHNIHPQLFNIVEEMKIAANLPAIPKIFIIDEQAPNAFAAGRDFRRSAIAVTAGLLTRLNRDELQGVIAHEMAHIINRDVLFMTFAGVMLGSISLISDVFLRSLRYSGGSSRRYRRSSRKGDAQLVLVLIAVIFAILAPILARLFYFAISRKREYLADAEGVRLTRYPEGLACALEKISSSNIGLTSVNKINAPMYIINPQELAISGPSVFSTHPPIDERIKILRAMAHGVNYSQYQAAFNSVRAGLKIIPQSGLKDKDDINIRETAILQMNKEDRKTEARNIGDLMRAVNGYLFFVCRCGLKIKLPPDFKEPIVSCPRCQHISEVPVTVGAALTTQEASQKKQDDSKEIPQRHVRAGGGWQTLFCSLCGVTVQLSPLFSGEFIRCHKCGKKIEIVNVSDF